jgi:outer membrane protein OmpA-like peptidoglycan-associated protein
MKRLTTVVVWLLLAASPPASIAQSDAPGCKDHPLFTRMPGYWIHNCAQLQFDSYAFPVGKGKSAQVEGQTWKISYYPRNDLNPKPSETQVLRNFENAVQKLGGTTVTNGAVAGGSGKGTFKLATADKEIWVEVRAEFTGKYFLTIVQKDAMAQDITANAEAFSNDLRATGHAAVYGIHFDTGRSTIKPESAQAIGEIAKLLQADAALKLYVVGHTDNVGGLESNIKLSQDRSAAVVQELVTRYGIATGRLKAYGCGLYAPVASNDSEAGRAKNRRVELVKQ